MPAYDAGFRPPAPVADVIVAHPVTGVQSAALRGKLDTGSRRYGDFRSGWYRSLASIQKGCFVLVVMTERIRNDRSTMRR